MNIKILVGIVFIITVIAVCGTFSCINWFGQIQQVVLDSGIWGYTIFVLAYAIATLLILPVTAFNIAGGAIYGGIEGLALTTLGALVSALLAFVLARSLDTKFIKIGDRWSNLSGNLLAGGVAYSFAARLFPLIPYGVVSFAAGLSPIKRRDYLLGTLLGTPLGIAPFVFLGSTGIQVSSSHDVLPLMASSMGVALLIVAGTWYQQSKKVVQAELVRDNYAELTERSRCEISEAIGENRQ